MDLIVKKTHIFRNSEILSGGKLPNYYQNTLKVMSNLTYNNIKSTFGISNYDNIGKVFFPACQITPALASTFYNDNPIKPMCLIPCAIEQDPYFRLCRNISYKLGENKPSLVHLTFLPSTSNCEVKMSSSVNQESTIFLNDTKKQISKKIKKSFSGGKELELHRKEGGDYKVDVSFNYLTFFLNDDEELESIKNKYTSGELLSGELKKKCIDVITPIILKHQRDRELIDDDIIKKYIY